MKTYFDCISCFVRQALDASRMITIDEDIHEQVLRKVILLLGEMDLRQTPPAMGQKIHRIIRKLTNNPDPYLEIKNHFNNLALEMYCELKQQIENSADPFETAVRLAIAGNIIDFGVDGELEQAKIEKTIKESLTDKLDIKSLEEFKAAITKAKDILYLGDNTGEIVFDKLLIEQLPLDKITFAVRSAPVINDATMADALSVGLTKIVNVIENGDDAPGTILENCSDEFCQRFERADLIIAKGQGNYETLSEVDKNIFFLLRAKCPVIARHLNCECGSMVIAKSSTPIML
ncbi:MAG: DUF89 family protein [Planctomycetes bacterium]|nr:DUF89 family protein [Planctomycetota bacterium]